MSGEEGGSFFTTILGCVPFLDLSRKKAHQWSLFRECVVDAQRETYVVGEELASPSFGLPLERRGGGWLGVAEAVCRCVGGDVDVAVEGAMSTNEVRS
jgi:hypothetical protein